MPALDILFENEHTLVVNKPSGLSTQAPRGIESLEQQVRAYLDERHDDKSRPLYLGLPHRLDRPVSGVIVLAKTIKAARKISKQFERRRVRKVYWAAVDGIVEPDQGTWIDHLRKIPGEARVEVVDAAHPEAQQAILHYRTLVRTPHGSWLEVELETGRMHQIRVQAASRGWPVLGDFQYGSQIAFGPQAEDRRLQGIALHAREISFVQPVTQFEVSYSAPLPAPWSEFGPEPAEGLSGTPKLR